jgi:hypothetical protein
VKNIELSDKEIELIDSLSAEESRGFTIERLYEIEMIIDDLIINYFNPNKSFEFKPWDFKNYLLNGNMLDFGKKIKILNGLEIINNKLADKLRRISSIRNSCAHAGIDIVHNLDIFIEDKKKEEKPKKRLDVMKSNGNIESKYLTELLIEFSKLYKVLKSELFELKYK